MSARGSSGVAGIARVPAPSTRVGPRCRGCGRELTPPAGRHAFVVEERDGGPRRPASAAVSGLCAVCIARTVPQAVPTARRALRAPTSRRGKRAAAAYGRRRARDREAARRVVQRVTTREADVARSTAAEVRRMTLEAARRALNAA